MAHPEMRVNWTRMMIDAYARRLDPAAFEAAMARVPRERARVEASPPLAWLPAEIHLAILEAAFDPSKAAAYRALWRKHMLESFDKPIFRGLVHGALRVFQRTPFSLMRVLPPGWSLVSCNNGTFVVDAAPDASGGEVRIVDLAPSYAASEAFATACAGVCDSFVELADAEGKVTMDRSKSARGELVYEVRWSARGGSGA